MQRSHESADPQAGAALPLAVLGAYGPAILRCGYVRTEETNEIALASVRARFDRLDREGDVLLDRLAAQVAARDTDPYTAADELLAAMDAAEG